MTVTVEVSEAVQWLEDQFENLGDKDFYPTHEVRYMCQEIDDIGIIERCHESVGWYYSSKAASWRPDDGWYDEGDVFLEENYI